MTAAGVPGHPPPCFCHPKQRIACHYGFVSPTAYRMSRRVLNPPIVTRPLFVLMLALALGHGTTAAHAAEAAVGITGWRTIVTPAPRPRATDAIGAITAAKPPAEHALDGVASYYWQGQTTASGETFDPQALTAAHRSLPFNTKVRVTNPQTGRSVVVRINDRGPFKEGRVIDVSDAAAEVLGMKARGLVPVRLEVLE